MAKCVICGHRPERTDRGYCVICASRIDKAQNNTTNHNSTPVKFLTYRGGVVGLYHNGKDTLIPRLLRRSPDNLPKSKTLDLNHYCEGFDRTTIKRFKACILQLTNT